MGLFSDLFLSRDDKAVIDIHNELSNYWKNTNDFLVAHQRFLGDLNFKFKLNFSDEILISLPGTIVTVFIMHNYSQKNTMFIFSQFIYFFVFGWHMPNSNRHTDAYILSSLKNIEDYIIKNQSTVDKDMPYILNKNFAKRLM